MSRLLLPAAGGLAGLAVAFLVMQLVITGAFEKLEARQVAQDAARIRIGLNSQAQLLTAFGATNAVRDDAYDDVGTSDRAGFAADFPPAARNSATDIDGMLGIGADGTLRVGGMTTGAPTHGTPPEQLRDPAVLRQLFDPAAAPGVPRCGIVSADAPYLFCGVGTFRSSGAGAPSGGMIMLKRLDGARVARLGQALDLPLRLTPRARTGTDPQPPLHSELGDLRVGTKVLDGDHIAVEAVIDTVNGGSVVLEVVTARPIRAAAGATAVKLFASGTVATVLLVIGILWGVRAALRRQVGPLRRATEQIVASGDRRLRINPPGTGDIAELGRAIDAMLDALQEHERGLAEERLAKEAQLMTTNVRQQLAEQTVRRRAGEVIDETSASALAEMRTVLAEADDVLAAADAIERQATAADRVTRTVMDRAAEAGSVISAVTTSLGRVDGIANLIAGVAGQTNLLALNATIEAARAGEAGRGFSVVAGEVKNLATKTKESTGEITSTVEALGTDASAMAGVITDMSQGVNAVGDVTAQLTAVAARQRASVEHLVGAVRTAITRIESLAQVTDRLERRRHNRAAVEGAVLLVQGPVRVEADLLDLSISGLRCASKSGWRPDLETVVDLTLLLGDERLQIQGRAVRHLDTDTAGEVGIEFARPSPDMVTTIDRYITTLVGDE